MSSTKAQENEGTRALGLVKWLADHAIDGVRPLSSAQDLATEYLTNPSYRDHAKRIDALIKWETSKNFTSGFVTGLGGLLTLPVALPAGFAASWVIQARMAAAIARICGHDLSSERIRTLIVATLVGDSIAEIATASGIRVGAGVGKSLIERTSRRGYIEFSKRVGSRLLRMAGQKSSVNLMKGVPLIGGIAGGTLDAVACRIVGRHARALFESTEASDAATTAAQRRTPPQRRRSGTGGSTDETPARKSSAKKSAGRKSNGRKKPSGAKKTAPSKRTAVQSPKDDQR